MLSVAPPSTEVVTSEFVPPSELDLYKHLQGFGSAGPSGNHLSGAPYADLFRELRTAEQWGPPLSGLLDPQALAKIQVPANTSPGIRWKRMGYKTKKEALMPAILEATRSVGRMIEEGKMYDVPPAGVAGRGKRVDMNRGEDKERKEGRLIVMPDLVRHLIGSMGAAPYMGALKDVDKTKGGVMLGMGPFSGQYEEMAKWCEGAKSFMFIDFKKFDQRIPAMLLEEVMTHIASKFESGPGTKQYWASEMKHLIRTEIAVPRGDVYRKKRGVASGDPWTSLADSYANWIILKRVCNLMGLTVKIWTFGDDSVIAVYDRVVTRADLERARDLAWEEFGMQVGMDKSYVSVDLVDIAEDPEEQKSGSFLSLYFLATPAGVRPTRPLQDLYELMLVPERNRETLQWEMVRTTCAYLTFYYNPNARYVLEEYWEWLHKKHSIPELTGTASDLLLLREMDIPWSSFRWDWINRLPWPGEVELMYKYGHTGYYPPVLWGTLYHKYDTDARGNSLVSDPRITTVNSVISSDMG